MKFFKAIKYLIIVIFFILFFYNISNSQDKPLIRGSNIRVNILEDRNIIYYDFLGEEESEYDVKMYLVFKQTGDSILLESVSGNIGKGVKSGKEKAIIWHYNDEAALQKRNLESDVEFHIWGSKIPDAKNASFLSRNTIYWIAGGTLVVGGGITYLLLSKKKDTTPGVLPDPVDLGVPPR